MKTKRNTTAIECNVGQVVLRGRGRAYAPGDTAFILAWAVKGLEKVYALPVVFRDGRYRESALGKPCYIPNDEAVTVID